MSKRSISKASKTDLKRIERLPDKDIDYSDIPPVSAQQFARAIVRRGLAGPKPKEQITLRLDADVLKWFRSQGQGYQTQINSLLRAYMQAHIRR